MVSPSNQVAQLVAVEKEASTRVHAPENEEIGHAEFGSSSEVAKEDEYGVCYLSEKPCFDVVLAKSHIDSAYGLGLPNSIGDILPRATVPVVLRHGGKTWNMSYTGKVVRRKFDAQWKTFVTDNNLKVGDGCVFELMESSPTNLVFKVHIVRGDIPPELQELIDTRGKTEEAAIVLD